jgi:hypothetical protein
MAHVTRQFPAKATPDAKSDKLMRLPHERDESHDSQESEPRADMLRAYQDITEGQMDTDLHGARGVEEVVRHRNAGKRPEAPADEAESKPESGEH